jgi:hypothetical protein
VDKLGSQDTQETRTQSMGLSLVFRVHDKESMHRDQMQTQMVQMEDASASQENIPGWPHGFGFQSYVRVCRDQTQRQHGSDNGCKNGDEPPS